MAAKGINSGMGGFYASAAVQVMGALVQADAVKKQAAIQADIDNFNAELAEYDAWRIQGAGQAQIARYQTQLDQAAGKAKVSAAAAGADIKTGSLSEIASENQLTGFLNKLDMDNRVREQAMGYKNQARNLRLQGDMRNITSTLQASSTITSGIAHAAGTVASGYYANKSTADDAVIPTKPTGTSPYEEFGTTMKPAQASGYSALPNTAQSARPPLYGDQPEYMPKYLMP